jgi:hypothetical protein
MTLGALAVLVWIATYSKCGGIELSLYLFPVSRFVLRWLYTDRDVPVLAWYSSAWFQWVALGILVDVVRWCRRGEEPQRWTSRRIRRNGGRST